MKDHSQDENEFKCKQQHTSDTDAFTAQARKQQWIILKNTVNKIVINFTKITAKIYSDIRKQSSQ